MKYKISDLIDSVSSKYDFSNKTKVIFLNTSDVDDGSIINHNYSRVDALPGQAKKSIKNGDILFSEIRPANKRFAFVNNVDEEKYVVSTKLMVLRNKNPNILNMRYFYYFLTSPAMLRYLQQEAEARSGTFPQITFKDNLGILNIELPTTSEQETIVSRLDTVQGKIKLNNQINDNLAA